MRRRVSRRRPRPTATAAIGSSSASRTSRQTDDGRHRRHALSRQRQVRAEIDQAAKEQRLEDDARGGETAARPGASPARGSRRAQEMQEMTSGIRRRLAHRRGHVPGKRRLAPLALGRVADPPNPDQHGAAHDHLLVARRAGGAAPRAPVIGRHQVCRFRGAPRLLPDPPQRALGIAAGEPARLVQGADHSERGIQGRHRLPAVRAGCLATPARR